MGTLQSREEALRAKTLAWQLVGATGFMTASERTFVRDGVIAARQLSAKQLASLNCIARAVQIRAKGGAS